MAWCVGEDEPLPVYGGRHLSHAHDVLDVQVALGAAGRTSRQRARLAWTDTGEEGRSPWVVCGGQEGGRRLSLVLNPL